MKRPISKETCKFNPIFFIWLRLIRIPGAIGYTTCIRVSYSDCCLCLCVWVNGNMTLKVKLACRNECSQGLFDEWIHSNENWKLYSIHHQFSFFDGLNLLPVAIQINSRAMVHLKWFFDFSLWFNRFRRRRHMQAFNAFSLYLSCDWNDRSIWMQCAAGCLFPTVWIEWMT